MKYKNNSYSINWHFYCRLCLSPSSCRHQLGALGHVTTAPQASIFLKGRMRGSDCTQSVFLGAFYMFCCPTLLHSHLHENDQSVVKFIWKPPFIQIYLVNIPKGSLLFSKFFFFFATTYLRNQKEVSLYHPQSETFKTEFIVALFGC